MITAITTLGISKALTTCCVIPSGLNSWKDKSNAIADNSFFNGPINSHTQTSMEHRLDLLYVTTIVCNFFQFSFCCTTRQTHSKELEWFTSLTACKTTTCFSAPLLMYVSYIHMNSTVADWSKWLHDISSSSFYIRVALTKTLSCQVAKRGIISSSLTGLEHWHVIWCCFDSFAGRWSSSSCLLSCFC